MLIIHLTKKFFSFKGIKVELFLIFPEDTYLQKVRKHSPFNQKELMELESSGDAANVLVEEC